MNEPSPVPPYDIEAWRERIPLLARTIPMNNCSQGPLTRATQAAAHRWIDSWNERGMDWDEWMGEVERAREAFARLIGARADEVAVTTSVSHATASVASALEFAGPRDRVAVTEAEFPTVGHVWSAFSTRGATVDWIPVQDGAVRFADYETMVGDRTLLVSATHGYYQTGFKQDIGAITRLAHDRGALVYVDAYQTLGTEPVDVHALGVDFLAAGTQKFLMGTPGIAFLYIRAGLVEGLKPAVTGWFGRAEPFAFDVRRLDWAGTARRFDTGTPPVAGAYVARAAIQEIEEVGPENVRAWTEVLSARLVEGGAARGLELVGPGDPALKTPTTAFRCPDAHRVERAMRERGVLASARGPVIRLAPHFYTTLDDVEAALDTLVEVVHGKPDTGRRDA